MAEASVYKNPTFRHLLAVTEELISEKGCRSTTLKDIMDRTGLSKGAIYHYVDSKDELFGLLLQSKVLEFNGQFESAVDAAVNSGYEFSPFEVIGKNFALRQDHQDAANQIFVYLLSQENEKVTKILHDVYQFGKEKGIKWLRSGQERGVIPSSVDINKMAVLFMVFSYGLRMKNILAPNEDTIELRDIFKWLLKSLT
jgi:AcrR family transcriptional regulator